MGLPTAFVSQEESQSWGRELRESSNANCAKPAIAVRPLFETNSTRPAPRRYESVRDDSRERRAFHLDCSGTTCADQRRLPRWGAHHGERARIICDNASEGRA